MASKRLSAVITIGGALSSSLRSAIGATKSQFGDVGSAIAKVRDRQKELNRVIAEQEKLGRAGSALKVQYARQELAHLDAQIGKLHKIETRIKSIQNAQQKNLARRSELRGQLFDAVALGATLAAPIREAVQFESAMADVRKVVDFDTPTQFKEMSRDVLQLSTRLPMAAEGIAQIVAAGGQAGIARDELLRFAESATKMGVAFDITADQSGQLMAEWRSAFKMNQDEVEELADKINILGNTTAASSPRISEVVRRVGPLGEVAGVASGEIAALGATLVGVGVSEEVAATGIQNLMLGLVAGEAATKKQQAAFEELGLDAEKMAVRMQTDARGAILSVLDAVRRLPEAKRASILTQLFGRESIKAIAPLLTVTDQLVTNLDRVTDAKQYAGAVEREYAERAKTAANNLQLFKNRAVQLGVVIGDVLLPPLNLVLDKVGALITGVADLAEKHPKLTKVITIGTAALIGMKVATIALGYAWTFPKQAVLSVIQVFWRFPAAAAAASASATAAGAATTAAAAGPTLLGRAFIWMGRQAWAGTRALFKASTYTTLASKTVAAGAAGVRVLGTAFTWLSSTAKAGALAVFRASTWTTLASKSMAAAAAAPRVLGTAFMWLARTVMMASLSIAPIGALVAGIAIIGTLVYKNWKVVAAFFNGFFQGIKEGMAPALEGLGRALEPIGRFWEWLKTPVEATTESIEKATAAGKTFGEIVGKVLSGLLKPIELLVTGVGKVWSFFKGDEKQQPPKIGSAVEKPKGVQKGTAAPGKPGEAVQQLAQLPQLPDAAQLAELPALPQVVAAPSSDVVNDNRQYTFNITQQPGQDIRALADEVMRRIDERQGVRRRSVMYEPAMVAP